VLLPVIEVEPEAEREPAAGLSMGREHVLLVDDENDLVEIGRLLLERLGYSVATRTSSIEALELFKSDPGKFQLVITDMTMPNMTGACSPGGCWRSARIFPSCFAPATASACPKRGPVR
jgi:hypothetical protein